MRARAGEAMGEAKSEAIVAAVGGGVGILSFFDFSNFTAR